MKRSLLLAFGIVACHPAEAPVAAPVAAAAPVAPPTLHGRVLAADTGQPMPVAHVAILGEDGKPGTPLAVAPDGAFSIPVASLSQRLTRVRFSGGAHRPSTLLVARDDGAVEVTVKLGAVAPRGTYKPSVILYTASEEPRPQGMKAQPDGSFTADLEGTDGLHDYGIVGVLNESPIGSPVDGWTPVSNGSYRPQVLVKGGKARITFDPRKLPEAAAQYDFANGGSTSAGASAAALAVAESIARGEARFDALLHAAGGPPPDVGEKLTAGRVADQAAVRADLAARIRGASRPVVKQATEVAYFTGTWSEPPTEEARAFAADVLASVPPDDTLWGAFDAIGNVLSVAGATPRAREYATAFIAKQPSTGAVGKLLLSRLRETQDPAERRPLVAELRKARFAGTMEQSMAHGYDPDRPLAPGKQVAFDVKTLAGAKLGPKELAGKVTLIDIWGTWCAPCIAELPRVHELHAKYGGKPAGQKKRFEVLSIAIEKDPKAVARFREDKAHPMPWMHGIAGDDDFIDTFAGPGMGVPFYVLVDEKGVVLASSPELSPRALPQLLDRTLR